MKNDGQRTEGAQLTNTDDSVVNQYLVRMIGEDGVDIVKRMPPGEIVDEEVAAETDININGIRRTLFKLYENRLASYRRERNPETGWLTYHWTIHLDNIDSRLDLEFEKLLENMRERLAFEADNTFYVCENNCARFLFETASETDFICQVCGEELFHQDNEKLIRKLAARISEMESALRS
ncbi:MAG TPA: transcription factor [Methanosarcinales archaeon]|nr:transcription factor [Methanosarcinales archaeon]